MDNLVVFCVFGCFVCYDVNSCRGSFFVKKKNILNFAVPFDCIHVTKFECHIETIFFGVRRIHLFTDEIQKETALPQFHCLLFFDGEIQIFHVEKCQYTQYIIYKTYIFAEIHDKQLDLVSIKLDYAVFFFEKKGERHQTSVINSRVSWMISSCACFVFESFMTCYLIAFWESRINPKFQAWSSNRDDKIT